MYYQEIERKEKEKKWKEKEQIQEAIFISGPELLRKPAKCLISQDLQKAE